MTFCSISTGISGLRARRGPLPMPAPGHVLTNLIHEWTAGVPQLRTIAQSCRYHGFVPLSDIRQSHLITSKVRRIPVFELIATNNTPPQTSDRSLTLTAILGTGLKPGRGGLPCRLSRLPISFPDQQRNTWAQ